MKGALAIIPARGGSKGIKRKNLRFLGYKPLIFYIIDTAKKSNYISDIVVTTDDIDIMEYVNKLGIKVRKRPEHLGMDNVPLDPVIYDAYKWYINNFNKEFEYVVTLQPTSPLLSPRTLDSAFEFMLENNFDTILSVTDNTHLMWKKVNEQFIPMYTQRVNRQWLPRVYKETGAFLITKSCFIAEKSRFGKRVSVFEVPNEEAIDIDTPIDWLTAEALLNKVKILIVTIGNNDLGLGHIYRTITLADSFLGNDVSFFLLNSSSDKARSIVKQYGYEIYQGKLEEVFTLSKRFNIIINDILDTDNWYISMLRKQGNFVVNFEDLGSGAQEAHIVFNALYERLDAPVNHRYGYKYAVLNEKFIIEPPNNFNDQVSQILITFGGVDQNNLTLRSIRALKSLCTKRKLGLKIIIGPAYKYSKELIEFLRRENLPQIRLVKDVKNMASEMRGIDLAITSNGRTVYELAAMRIPMISIAQNDRETLHTFARYNSGVKYLGIACNITEAIIRTAVVEIINNRNIRYNMYQSLPYDELRQGIWKVKEEILNLYRRWKKDENKTWQ